MLPPFLQSLADAEAPVRTTSSAGEAVLLFNALLLQQLLSGEVVKS